MYATALFLLMLGPTAVVGADSDKPLPRQDLFTSQVRPILARHCFKCHGPDDQARKARLRLDVREQALRPGRSG
jgi:hypothetical protein